ncbi:DUF6479 family protein [Streptomyces sp. NPDC051366]|uniref:DUF6479 family protein n=1 Tax=Streptomyces sp. NPDC051366 TaxID=3365652 RepID=UPI00378BCCB0
MVATEILADEGQGPPFLILAGVGVVVLLIGAVWYGSRRSARRRAPTVDGAAVLPRLRDVLRRPADRPRARPAHR